MSYSSDYTGHVIKKQEVLLATGHIVKSIINSSFNSLSMVRHANDVDESKPVMVKFVVKIFFFPEILKPECLVIS